MASSHFPPARPISEGATLAIVAPAGPFDREAFDRGVEWLRQRYVVKFDEGIFSKTGYFAGPDERRLQELTNALTDPSVDAILCVRGGYGATRLLPNLDPQLVADANKTLVGFSDITALHSLWARAGVRSIHAPMVAALGKASEPIRDKWTATLESTASPSPIQLTPISKASDASVSGRFFGGNLAVLGALIGTPYAPPLEGSVLFIEDVGERPYRIDRMLTTLKQAGWFDNITALVLGAFTEGNPGPDGITIEDVFTDHFADFDKPVVSGLSAGHISDNEPLAFGVKATLADCALTLDP